VIPAPTTMNEEQRKQIEQLNRKHFTEFGVEPDGRLRFQWMRTDEMPIEFGRDCDSSFDRETGLWLARRTYKRRTFAETHGHGLCWTIAFLQRPLRDEWILENGTDFPWPANGFYRPVDNIVLLAEILPGEEESMRAAYNIRCSMEIIRKGQAAAYEHFLQEEERASLAQKRAYQSRLDDFIDNATPAFNNNPGGKGCVSLPS